MNETPLHSWPTLLAALLLAPIVEVISRRSRSGNELMRSLNAGLSVRRVVMASLKKRPGNHVSPLSKRRVRRTIRGMTELSRDRTAESEMPRPKPVTVGFIVVMILGLFVCFWVMLHEQQIFQLLNVRAYKAMLDEYYWPNLSELEQNDHVLQAPGWGPYSMGLSHMAKGIQACAGQYKFLRQLQQVADGVAHRRRDGCALGNVFGVLVGTRWHTPNQTTRFGNRTGSSGAVAPRPNRNGSPSGTRHDI